MSKNNIIHYNTTHIIPSLLKIEPKGQAVGIIGRIINLRNNKMFVVLRFEGYDLQCLCQEPVLQKYGDILHKGNIIYVEGMYTLSNTSSLMVKVSNIELISACQKQIHKEYFIDKSSEKYSKEIRVKQLTFSLVSFHLLNTRFLLMAQIRSFFVSQKFLEVDTPVLQDIAGGAFAKPFETKGLSKKQNLYLRIAPELFLKRLIISGYSQVFEIAKNFRNEGLSAYHNPEFTMLEAYSVNCKVEDMINMIIRLIKHLAAVVVGRGHESIDKTFAKSIVNYKVVYVSFKEFVEQEFNGIDINDAKSATLEVQRKYNLQFTEEYVYPAEYFYDILTKQVLKEKYVDCIVVLTDQPAIISPLATASGEYADRFEIYINAIEVSDGFNEQNDFKKQETIFKNFQELTGNGYDSSYIQDMMLGMYNTCGVGIGLDRLFCMLTNSSNIRDVIGWTT